MLKKLRIKFVIVVMSVVTVLFAAIFGLVMHMTKQNIESESIQMMRAMAFRPPTPNKLRRPDRIPGDEPRDIRLPVFTVSVSDDGTITAEGGGYYDLSDEQLLSDLMETVNKSNKQSGVISAYDLRFLKSDRDSSVIFADVSREKSLINELVRNSLIIGLIAYVIFFVISLLLAKWVTKPVEKSWNEQKQFIADASHELKTPLTVIMTNAEMLGSSEYSDEDRGRCTQKILSTSKRMRGLIESLLELARLDNNKMPIEFSRVDMSKLTNECILMFEPLFFENSLELESDIDSGITAKGDRDKLRQVVDILLDNALKYSDKTDKVRVTLKSRGTHCTLSVSGKGAHLSKEDCKNIFKRFYRTDQSRNDNQSYGLGLSIAESIMGEHGGSIRAESENGTNTFIVQLQNMDKNA